MFLSHRSSDKDFGANLKRKLGPVKVDVFVAHEDIEPNLTWQQPFVSKSKTLKDRIQTTLSNFGFAPPTPIVVSADEYDPFADE